MKPNEVRDKSSEELRKLAAELTEEVFRLRFKKNSGQLKQTANITKSRRDLARVMTVLRERENASRKEAGR